MDKSNKFTMEYIRSLAMETSHNSIVSYEDLPQYDLFLSQVIDFLNDKFEEEKYTSNIVQNYIKGEIISKPEDSKKRGYTKEHLAQLVLLSYMRPILTTDEIKKVFGLVFNDINNKNDDIIEWEKAYKIFSKIQKDVFEDFLSESHFNEEELDKIMKESNLGLENKERISVFILVMTLIAQASVIKKFAKRIVDAYNEG